MRFRHGEAEAPLAIIGEADGKTRHGSHFPAVDRDFTMTCIRFATLEHRLRELAFLNSGVRLIC